MSWYAKAAAAGSVIAARHLGRLYETGAYAPVDGLPDLAAALDWYEKAAQGGLATAQYKLGKALYEGKGAARDPVQGLAWIEKIRRAE